MPSLKIRISLGITDMKPPKTTGMLGFNNGDQRLTVRHSIAHIRYCVYLIIIVPILSPLLYLLFVLNYSGLYGCWNHNFRFICLCLFLNPIFHAQTQLFPRVFPGFPTFFARGKSPSFNLGRRAGRCKMATTTMLRAMTLMSPACRSYKCLKPYMLQMYIYIYTLWIQTLSEQVLKPPNCRKLYSKHFLRRYLDP